MGNANSSSNRNNPYRGIKKKMTYGGTGCFDSRGKPIPCPSGVKDGSVITSNPKDPRLQAYNDSLAVYNYANEFNGIAKSLPRTNAKNIDETLSTLKIISKLEDLKQTEAGKNALMLNKVRPDKFGFINTGVTRIKGVGLDYELANQTFPKPVQPVIYQNPQQQNKPTYADSLRAYKSGNWSQGDHDRTLPLSTEQKDFWKTAEGIKPIGWKSPEGFSTQVGHPIFKKPVGTPQPQRPIHPRVVSYPTIPQYNMSAGAVPTPHNMDIPQANYDTSRPTKYSFTYPTGVGQNGQKTQYFPTQGALDEFLKGVKGASSQAGEGYKTATGYLKRGGYNLKNIYNFLYEDDNEDTPKGDNIPTAPTTDDLPDESPQQDGESEDDNLALAIAFGDFSSRNPYIESNPTLKKQMGVNPYLQETANDIFGSYKGVSNLGVWGDKAHQQRQSDHNTGDAQDFGASDPKMGEQIISKLQNEAKDRNVKYIIYNGRIWDPSKSNDWRKYNGPDPHTTHIHVSYNR